MGIIVDRGLRGQNVLEYTVEAADDMDVDDIGTLILTAGDGREEKTVYLRATGAWMSAERT